MKETEASSLYNDLDKMDIHTILKSINEEDKKVPFAIEKSLSQIEKLVEVIAEKMISGGRLFYIGAGTSGRLGIVDASECPPTFGVPYDLVIGMMAGGDVAMRKAAEGAEDNKEAGALDLKSHNFSDKDVVVGIAASGRTPYVIGGLEYANAIGAPSGCVVCTSQSAVAAVAKYPVEVITGPEFVTGSTRMKAGTAQKLVLNMLTTAAMIKLGRVKGNKMVDMMLTNEKLVDRGTKMVVEATGLSYQEAEKILLEKGSVRNAIDSIITK
ncbi:MAG: N-acetylmuramic acid 6-phosphate etherase [Bacteroidota bacterium]|nr:N-acetylmuramic acid 6-phosphate etherase [Bacteroidota bacterium]